MSAEKSPISESIKPGKLIQGKYLIERVLGEGGMGVVVLATHQIMNEKIAIKFLHNQFAKEEKSIQRFYREAQAAAKIKGNNICRIFDVSKLDDGTPFLVMEYLEGKELDKIIQENFPLDLQFCCDIVVQTCLALASAHCVGIIHRDIKAENLFVTKNSDGSPCLKVLDFGISKIEDSVSMTQTNVAMGSPLYMSPEQMRSAKNATEQSDIWSLGVVFYEMLTGIVPYEAESMPELVAKILEEEPAHICMVRPDLPPELNDIVLKCLRKTKEERYLNVAELAEKIAPYCSDEGIELVKKVRKTLDSGSGSIYSYDQNNPSGSSTEKSGKMRGLETTKTAFGKTLKEPSKSNSGKIILVAAFVLFLSIAGFVVFLVTKNTENKQTNVLNQPKSEPVEIIKTVIHTVEKEVVKEVPKEVVKEVPVKADSNEAVKETEKKEDKPKTKVYPKSSNTSKSTKTEQGFDISPN